MRLFPGEFSFGEFDFWLDRAPVIGNVHPLVPLCLRQGTKIVLETEALIRDLDSQSARESNRLLILSRDRATEARFPELSSLEHPPIEAINMHMSHNLNYARTHLLTNHKIAGYIESEVAQNDFDVVVLFLVDGLSYGDTLEWECELEPCFVDNVSVTYRFVSENENQLIRQVGFAAIINNPSVYSRLYQHGYHSARGYTYWDRSNAVTDYLFAGIPCKRVVNFESVLEHLAHETIRPQTYIQIIREGLDGLAHGKRELQRAEIEAVIAVIKNDLLRLGEIIHSKHLSACIFLTADHGILWKNEHAFKILTTENSKPRYASHRPSDDILPYTARIESDDIPYYLFLYPYLGAKIRANDSGVHGGLSYQESIVPFIKFKV